jgi:outer membrane protein TolC
VFCAFPLAAQSPPPDQTPQIEAPVPGSWATRFFMPYFAPHVSPPNLENTPRLYSLMRAGGLYLSLSDAIALAIENNLDIVNQRYSLPISSTDVLRAKGGGTLRGISLLTNNLPPGIGGPSTPLLNSAATGTLTTVNVPSNLAEINAITPPVPTGISITGATPLSAGPPVPPFDPALTGQVLWQHSVTPENTSLASGGPTFATHGFSGDLGFQQGFSPGTVLGASFNAQNQSTNATNSRLNPSTSSTLGLTLTQPLLRGFGSSVNRRYIRIAKNNQKTADMVFKQQTIATVAGVVDLYHDLISLIEDVRVKQETLALAERLYEDTRIQVQQGTLAPVELTRAQAGTAAARQDLANSRGYELQQEILLKTVLTKRGTFEPALRNLRVIPTSVIDVPEQEPVRVVEDLVSSALAARPEMEEARLEVQNTRTALEGSRNELLPQLDLIASAQSMGLNGQPNAQTSNSTTPPSAVTQSNTQSSTGGLGTGLAQIASARYPEYSIGVQLTLPLRNRIAQADVARDELVARQWDVQYQQLQNQIRLQVEAAVIALDQARTAYDAAVETRKLQEQSLAIEQEKYQTGLSTTLLVMQYQSYVAQARSTEVAARGIYAKALNALERAAGATLMNNNVTVEEAYRGRVR